MSQLLLPVRDPALDYLGPPSAFMLGQTADELYELNYHRAACVMARQTLQASVAAICSARHCTPFRSKSGRPRDWRVGEGAFISTLRSLDHLSRRQSDAVRMGIRYGDRAAHGYSLTPERVQELLDTMRELIGLI